MPGLDKLRALQLLENEEQMLGRSAKLIDYAFLAENVSIIVYETVPISVPEYGAYKEVRAAVFSGATSKTGIIVKTLHEKV